VFHQYTIAVAAGERDALQGALAANGVSTMVYYPFPLHKMKVFKDGKAVCAAKLSHAEEACATVLSLPIEPLFTSDETAYVVEAVKTFFAKCQQA
jgi:dTDP-4-amino-4,6-dideoxygalactose transaminase